MSQVPERHRHLQDCVADEGKMVSQMRENQGCFGVTDEGDLVSQMRGLPHILSDRTQHTLADRLPDRLPDRMPERVPDRMSERMFDRMPDRMPDKMPERI